MATLLLLGGSSATLDAQQSTGLDFGILPAVNYNSDEGFGLGAIAEIYEYGPGGIMPYVWKLRPTVFFTTEGRRNFVAFFDAPHLLPDGWRLTGFLGSENHIATPYYGVGNDTPYDPALEDPDGPNPYYYRYGRERNGGWFMFQRGLRDLPLRVLAGGGIQRISTVPVPKGEGSTLYEMDEGSEPEKYWTNFVQGGLVWDTRDRETGPTRGTWTDVLVQWTDEAFGADESYVRWTVTDRRYFPLADGLVFAHRYLIQGVSGTAPISELFTVQTSFEQQEGLGGSKTIRGVLKDRLVGRGMLVWNAELRWRMWEFGLLGRPSYLVLSAFVDQGRVWEDRFRLDEVFSDLTRGFGGGIRLGMGENFVAALDLGTSSETRLPIYLGLGYLY